MRNVTGRWLHLLIPPRHRSKDIISRKSLFFFNAAGRCERRCHLLLYQQPFLNGLSPSTQSPIFRSLSTLICHYSSTPDYSVEPLVLDYRDPANINQDAFLQFIRQGKQPTKEWIYQHVRALYKAGDLYGLIKLHDTLIAHNGGRPLSNRQAGSSRYMYSMIITLLGRCREIDFDIVIRICHQMKDLKIKGTTELYNPLLRLCFVHDKDPAAQAVLQHIMENFTPSKYTYAIIIQEAIRKRHWSAILHQLDQMADAHILIDKAITGLVIQALCSLKEFDLAINLVDTMHRALNSQDLLGSGNRARLLCLIELRRRMSELAMLKRRKRRNKLIEK